VQSDIVIGSPGIAAWVAQAAFWMLLVLGWVFGELQVKVTLTFLGVWIAALLGLPHVPHGAALFPSLVALLDIALVLVIFKGDIRLT
jgi:hypothetical protein